MSEFQTINTVDIMDTNAVRRFFAEIPNRETHFSLVQNGVEIAKVVPVEKKSDKVSDEVTKQRWEAFERAEALSKEIARLWSTDETAVEAITNDRNASARR